MTQQPFENDDYAQLVQQMTRDTEAMGRPRHKVIDVGAVTFGHEGQWHLDLEKIKAVEGVLKDTSAPDAISLDDVRIINSEIINSGKLQGSSPPKGAEVNLPTGADEGDAASTFVKDEPEGWRLPVDKNGRVDVDPRGWALNLQTMSGMLDRFFATREPPTKIKGPAGPQDLACHTHQAPCGPTGSTGPTGDSIPDFFRKL